MNSALEKKVAALELNLLKIARYSIDEIEKAKRDAKDIVEIIDNLEALWSKHAKVWNDYADEYNSIKDEDRVYVKEYSIKCEEVEKPDGKGIIVHVFEDGKRIMRDYGDTVEEAMDGLLESLKYVLKMNRQILK